MLRSDTESIVSIPPPLDRVPLFLRTSLLQVEESGEASDFEEGESEEQPQQNGCYPYRSARP